MGTGHADQSLSTNWTASVKPVAGRVLKLCVSVFDTDTQLWTLLRFVPRAAKNARRAPGEDHPRDRWPKGRYGASGESLFCLA